MSRKHVFDRIERDISTSSCQRACLIGVNGVDTSGKTIFAVSLAEYLAAQGRPVQLISLDDFHHPKARRETGENPIDAYITNAFDLDRLVSELLVPARNGKQVRRTLPVLDLATDEFDLSRTYSIDSDTIVILEGVLLFRPPLVKFIDYRIFLDITFEEVLKRAEQRDVPIHGPSFLDRYREKYIPIQQRYLAEHDPVGRSDLVIDNTDWDNPRIKN